MVVRFIDVGVDVAGVRPLFSHVTAELPRGWTNVVGANGAGKSTLLSLVSGDQTPSSGRVLVQPAGAKIALVRQSLPGESPPDPLRSRGEPSGAERAFVGATDRTAVRLRAELGIPSEIAAARWATLSPGERRRIQIASALWEEPDILLCDEPDAHLDAEGLDILLRALSSFRGVGVLVSHHRGLLDDLARATLWLEAGTATLYEGGYSRARARKDIDRESLVSERDARRRELTLAQQARDHARRRHEGASRSVSARARMKDKNDHDARGALRKGAAEHAAARLGRLEGVLAAKVERSDERLHSITVERELGGNIRFVARPSPEGRVAIVTEEAIRAGAPDDARDGSGPVVLGRTSLVVRASTRVRVEGPNGAGKSTLLSALHRRARPDATLYLPQAIDEPRRRALSAELRDCSKAERGRWLSLVALLGADPDHVLASSCLSPGEARKLAIARALLREVAALFLDEPTNDLDLPSIERLERALVAYDGAIVLVTHDDRFARAITGERWTLVDGRVELSAASSLDGNF